MEFKVGMRVKFARSGDLHEQEGTVCHVTGDNIGVEWDKRHSYMHNCEGRCKSGHGYYVLEDEIIAIDEEDAVMTSVETQSTLKLEELEYALPLLGLRVMIHPDKFDNYDGAFHNQTGTIMSLEGNDSDIKNVISRYKRGKRDTTWKVMVRFDDGLSEYVRCKDMLPVGTEHKEVWLIDISGYGKMRLFPDEYKEKINNLIIVQERRIRSKKLITNVERQLVLDQA